jgi:conjugative transposon TraM protein
MKNRTIDRRKLLMLIPFTIGGILLVVFVLYRVMPTNPMEAGKDTVSESQFNRDLPEPQLRETGKNKLQLYMEAEQDSLRAVRVGDSNTNSLSVNPLPSENLEVEDLRSGNAGKLRQQEARASDQINRIMKELQTPQEKSNLPYLPNKEFSPDVSGNLSRIETLMKELNNSAAEPDSAMLQLSSMLDKIIQIQNPKKVTAVEAEEDSTVVAGIPSLIAATQTEPGFYGLQDETKTIASVKTAVKAVIHNDQTVYNGSTVQLRLLDQVFLEQQAIPAGSLLWGRVTIANDRAGITLSKLVHGGVIYPIKLTVYDTDGMAGIHVKGALTEAMVRDGMGAGIQSLSLPSLDPSIAAQATSAGIQSLRGLLGRKVRQVKVTLKAGHLVYLQ